MANFSLRMLHGTELSVFFPLFRGEGGRTHVKIVCCKYYIILEAIWQFTLKGLLGVEFSEIVDKIIAIFW